MTGGSGASWGSPVRPYSAGGKDAFIAKLNASGSLVWNTFLGASDNVVSFGKKKATVSKATATRLTVKIPADCKRGTVNVEVKVDGVKSNEVPFTAK
ncbi:MAG: hypothetical protein HYX75_02575 [Acidobacteria bacterium]|nr:hypothetical protein [Acidobacteriota bacterium]